MARSTKQQLEYQKEYRRKNRDRIREQKRQYRLQHLEEEKERTRKWLNNNPERARRNRREWARRNPDKVKRGGQKWMKRNRLKVLIHYGGNPPKCVYCGFDKIDCLDVDHIDRNDKKKMPKTKRTGKGFHKWIIDNDFLPIFQVLCKNCNWLKYLKSLNNN